MYGHAYKSGGLGLITPPSDFRKGNEVHYGVEVNGINGLEVFQYRN